MSVLLTLALFTQTLIWAQIPPPNPNKQKENLIDDMALIKQTKNKPISIFDHKHIFWNETLQKYVLAQKATSQVNYKKLKDDQKKLNQYLTELTLVTAEEFGRWTQPQQLAFLINAYNAFTIKLVLDNYPVKSIKKIGGFFSSPWKKNFFKLLGETRNLDWIEHKVLRKKFNEPRIHFAINCASIGCPALRPEAYVASRLSAQLEEQTQLFIGDASRNEIRDNQLYISKIFDWFAQDFEKSHGSVEKFIAAYITKDDEVAQKIRNQKFKIKYTKYDWKLNEVGGQ